MKKNLADKVGNNILRDNEHKQFLLWKSWNKNKNKWFSSSALRAPLTYIVYIVRIPGKNVGEQSVDRHAHKKVLTGGREKNQTKWESV